MKQDLFRVQRPPVVISAGELEALARDRRMSTEDCLQTMRELAALGLIVLDRLPDGALRITFRDVLLCVAGDALAWAPTPPEMMGRPAKPAKSKREDHARRH